MTTRVKTGGRQAGTPNKATADVRHTIATLARENAPKLQQWLDSVADGNPEHGVKPDPAKAADLFLRAIEYHIPKLGRVEHVGDEGEAIKVDVTLDPSEAYKRLVSGG